MDKAGVIEEKIKKSGDYAFGFMSQIIGSAKDASSTFIGIPSQSQKQ
jgi:hypothetical protein